MPWLRGTTKIATMRPPHLLAVFFILAFAATALAETPAANAVRVLTDLPYKAGEKFSEYEQSRCRLDVYLPPAGQDFPTLVWFHGGGLKRGDKDGRNDPEDSVKTAEIARSFAAAGIAVVAPNYRLSPRATFPAYIEDAAAAVAWTRAHIAEHGGRTDRLFVGGHSAGGYLALMLGLDARFLTKAGLPPDAIAGFLPVSGQTLTHYTIREEQGREKYAITADEAAPLHFVRADTAPFLILYADRDMAARAEENALLVSLLKAAGNKRVTGQLITDRTHGSIASELVKDHDPARAAILAFIRTHHAAK